VSAIRNADESDPLYRLNVAINELRAVEFARDDLLRAEGDPEGVSDEEYQRLGEAYDDAMGKLRAREEHARRVQGTVERQEQRRRDALKQPFISTDRSKRRPRVWSELDKEFGPTGV
jgi:hypothetical protein